MTGSRFIECAQLDLIGETAVLANASGKRMPLAITDAVIDERTFAIRALELSRGYLDDLTGGRECIRQFTVQKNGDVVVGQSEGGKLT